MAIPISCLTAVLKKDAIDVGYPGGVARFLEERPGVPQDEDLVGVPFMSSGDLQQFADMLKAIGFDVAQGYAVGEMFHGEWEACQGIEFTALNPGRSFSRWEARATPKGGHS